MATARLRKAFRYPDDSGDEHREELDEEEQERVINQLQMQNDRRNAEYTMIFAAIPSLSTIVFLPSMLAGSSTLSERCLAFLSIISLAATAYAMKYLPLQGPDRKGKRPIYKPDYMASIRKYLLPVNSALCVLVALVYVFAGSEIPPQSTRPALYLVPGAMLASILVARRVMLSVDIGPLKDLQYEFKGA